MEDRLIVPQKFKKPVVWADWHRSYFDGSRFCARPTPGLGQLLAEQLLFRFDSNWSSLLWRDTIHCAGRLVIGF